MVERKRTVLVTGATGNQGGAVARHLLDEPGQFEVHGLTRDPSSSAAQQLEEAGATMVQGDLYEPSTLTPLVEEVDAIFGVSDFWSEGYDGQVEQMTNLARAASEVGVDHFVLSGVSGSNRDTGIPHFDSCDDIERTIEDLGLPATFLRPVFFMQNFEAFFADILDGTLAFPIAEDTNHQMIDLTDIGRVTAQVLADPDQHVGQAYELAGDEGTLAEIAETFSEVTGVEVEPFYVPIDQAREQFGEESAQMCQWFIDEGFQADVEATNKRFGPMTTLREYLEREGWDQDKSEPGFITSWVEAVG